MKTLKLITLTTALLMTLSAFAQNQNLVGHITDENGEPMPFVNVMLLSLPDSTFVQGTVTDDQGSFILPTDKREGLLKVSFVGYQTQYAKAANGLTIQMKMDSQVLGEVVVKSQLPQTRLTGNSMITTIQGSVLEDSGTAQEMLTKVPGMTGSEDGLEVLGKGSPIVYINGRLMRDDTELRRLRSEDIRDVEVINNPGAQYDATVRRRVRSTPISRNKHLSRAIPRVPRSLPHDSTKFTNKPALASTKAMPSAGISASFWSPKTARPSSASSLW